MPERSIHSRSSPRTILTSGLSQCGQRMTNPAPRYTCVAPIAPAAPHAAHVPVAVVTSTANTSCNRPATALPSSMPASISASSRAEAFGLDCSRVMPKPNQRLCHRLDERRRAADVNAWSFGGARSDLREHFGIDAAGISSPPRRLSVRQDVDNAKPASVQAVELLAVDDVVPAARREQQSRLRIAFGGRAESDHRHERCDARSARDEQERTALRGLPNEVAADRPAKLDLITRPKLISQVGRHFAVIDTHYGQPEAGPIRCRSDRVAAFCLVAVLGGQPDVDV